MKIKIKAKSDSCNCQGKTGSGCSNDRKSEAPIDLVFAWIGVVLLFGAIALFIYASVDEAQPSARANIGQIAEVLGIMCFGVAMARWRG